eukprot:Blabericola_migrator_1__5524@NODE_2818_length_2320_cov_118_625832_g990_i1_p2_GENE_NODE_2818_length_2320_cov_118_625832_g990_i1NODE_2818_length_2320_cov_118_625832_g990_i1_p2_ORF_typecomplete_len121_score5_59HgmA/PF04209_13/0_066_NODE_2818_length_2320_cov_118_625832_g990_i168430
MKGHRQGDSVKSVGSDSTSRNLYTQTLYPLVCGGVCRCDACVAPPSQAVSSFQVQPPQFHRRETSETMMSRLVTIIGPRKGTRNSSSRYHRLHILHILHNRPHGPHKCAASLRCGLKTHD